LEASKLEPRACTCLAPARLPEAGMVAHDELGSGSKITLVNRVACTGRCIGGMPMLGLRLGSSLLKGIAAILCISGIAWLALAYFIPAPPSKFTIATGAKNQTYEAIGKRYRDILARSWGRLRCPGHNPEIQAPASTARPCPTRPPSADRPGCDRSRRRSAWRAGSRRWSHCSCANRIKTVPTTAATP